jgi:leader peptidase (prepilin peptidase)/N-methyltransferase
MQMSPADALVAAAASGVAGLVLARWLGTHAYRLPEEAHTPRRSTAWVAPAMALAGAVAWLSTSPGQPVLVPLVFVVSTWVMVALAFIDLDVHRLPNFIQLPAYPVLAVLLVACSWATGDWSALLRAAASGAALFVLFLLLALIGPRGAMGFGDVKLAGLLGMLLGWLAWQLAFVTAMATFIIGGVVGLVLLITGRAGRGSEFAYGPSMLLGGVLAMATPLLVRAFLHA